MRPRGHDNEAGGVLTGDAPQEDAGEAATPAGAEQVRCPACGGANTGAAVFCANAECGKALGPFAYVLEELERRERWHERVADNVAGFVGRPQFILTHAVWFAVWLAVNTGLIASVRMFDAYPYSLLGLILSVETIFITGFLLISQNRQNAHADKRAELDYEVNVRTYREIDEVKTLLRELRERLDTLDGNNHQPAERAEE